MKMILWTKLRVLFLMTRFGLHQSISVYVPRDQFLPYEASDRVYWVTVISLIKEKKIYTHNLYDHVICDLFDCIS